MTETSVKLPSQKEKERETSLLLNGQSQLSDGSEADTERVDHRPPPHVVNSHCKYPRQLCSMDIRHQGNLYDSSQLILFVIMLCYPVHYVSIVVFVLLWESIYYVWKLLHTQTIKAVSLLQNLFTPRILVLHLQQP